MKTITRLIVVLLLLAIYCEPAMSQVRKKKTSKTLVENSFKPQTATIDSLINSYCFDKAINLIEADISRCENLGQTTKDLEKQHARALLGKNMLEAVEKVTIVDSFVVDKSQILKVIALDSNCGHILTPQQIKQEANLKQMPIGMGFLNNFRDQVVFCQSGKGGVVSLVSSEKFGDKWSTPRPLAGLVDSVAQRGYPFVLADGITLYFASKDSCSLGGYDIYSTRFDSEDKAYLKPQNMGMPFNSTANDYMMAFDEVNQLGWFVSDRFQPQDKVCVYVFIPSQTRQTYENLSEAQLLKVAQIHDIKSTQKGYENVVANARKKLKDISSTNPSDNQHEAFAFNVAYGIRYTSLSQFRNSEAKKMTESLLSLKKKNNELLGLLKENRQKFEASQSAIERKALQPMILRQEQEAEDLYKQINDLANKIRKAEHP